ncbi:Do family serine endopeptidase [Bryobacter aggregatus]|uniref:Do family serine endopeptidase n=1 Tax=Bryobacter aggregatus TaxID=360054 RepID=UPI0005606D76|nr:Do family serine endopeptidase [Bryobacter aggregatus]
MNIFSRMREQRFLGFSMLLVTLSVGILIGTVLTTGVKAGKEQVAPDATPLVVPSPVLIQNEFAKLAKRAENSVVHINTVDEGKQNTSMSQRRGRPAPDDEADGEDDQMELFRRFFRNGPQGQGGMGGAMPSPKRMGTGSGFIVDKNGYIITNFHVVDGADKITVKLHNDSAEYKARVIGFDKETDLAVIKISSGTPLTPLPVGNSDAVEVGDWAIAIGSPFGLDATVTAGIVSAKGRDFNGAQAFQRFIQTDAAINPGNSGGPLLNSRGEVIGINTMIATRTGGYEGIGFALPVNMAVKVYNQIISSGRVTRGSIGVQFARTMDPTLMKAFKLDGGVPVTEVVANGPSARAGLKAEDIITRVNGALVKNGDELIAKVSELPVGSKASIEVDRQGKKMNFDVAIEDRQQLYADNPIVGMGKRPDDAAQNSQQSAQFGIMIANLPEAEAEKLGIPEKRGVQVTRVVPGSFSEEIGVADRDVIVSINRQPVGSVDDVKRIQATLKPGDAVAFRVMRAAPGSRKGVTGPAQGIWLSGTLPRD